MDIKIAEVVSTSDATKQGRICASIDGVIRTVVYTSPYLGIGGDGGMIAIPEPGSKILVVEEQNGRLYYLTTISENPDSGDSANYTNPLASKDIYDKKDKPQALVIESPRGHRLVLEDSDNKEAQNFKAEVKSSQNKIVSLNDTEGKDCILIKNGHGDKIKMQDGPSNFSASRSLEIDTVGPQEYLCRESSIDIRVQEGKDINIINESTGTNSPGYNTNHAGNINIRAEERDINLAAGTEARGSRSGRIFLDAGELIQLDVESGRIIINATVGDIEINAPTGSITMNAGQEINLQAGKSINIASLGNIDIQSVLKTYVYSAARAVFKGSVTHIGSLGNLTISSDTVPAIVFGTLGPLTISEPPVFYIPKILTTEINYYGD